MLYVIQTGYVIKDDPMPINEEADKILRKVGGLVGVSFVGSSSGLGTRYMAFGLDVGVQSVEAEKVLSAFNALIGKLRPTNAPYTFLDGSVCGYEERKDPLFATWGGGQEASLNRLAKKLNQIDKRIIRIQKHKTFSGAVKLEKINDLREKKNRVVKAYAKIRP